MWGSCEPNTPKHQPGYWAGFQVILVFRNRKFERLALKETYAVSCKSVEREWEITLFSHPPPKCLKPHKSQYHFTHRSNNCNNKSPYCDFSLLAACGQELWSRCAVGIYEVFGLCLSIWVGEHLVLVFCIMPYFFFSLATFGSESDAILHRIMFCLLYSPCSIYSCSQGKSCSDDRSCC